MTGIKLIHVPYKGGNQAVTDLVGGQIPLLFSSMTTAIPYVQSKKIKAIAVTYPSRASALPDTPTVAESGLAGFDASVWFAMVGPAGLPADILIGLDDYDKRLPWFAQAAKYRADDDAGSDADTRSASAVPGHRAERRAFLRRWLAAFLLIATFSTAWSMVTPPAGGIW